MLTGLLFEILIAKLRFVAWAKWEVLDFRRCQNASKIGMEADIAGIDLIVGQKGLKLGYWAK